VLAIVEACMAGGIMGDGSAFVQPSADGMSANTRSAWSLANARRVIGYAPPDDSGVVYADEIGKYILDPQRDSMVQGEARGGQGSR